jgi:hypothetical protein
MPFEKLNSLYIVLGINFGYFSVRHEEFGLAILDFGGFSLGEVTIEAFNDSTIMGG